MDWKSLRAYITGSVAQALLVRHTALVTENRVLRHQSKGRVRLTAGERKTLAAMGKQRSTHALAEVATMVTPETILAWHRTLVAQKFDGSQQRQALGRPRVDQALEDLVVRLAQENRRWGDDRLAGALAPLGSRLRDQTRGNILKPHGIPPAPARKKPTPWQACLRTPMAVRVATDCFTAAVWTWGGLVTSDGLCRIRRGTREVHLAGCTPHPDHRWRAPVARQVTLVAWGFWASGPSLLHARDGTYGPACQPILDDAGVTRVPLPPRSPHVQAYAERWGRSVKEAARSRVIFVGEPSRRPALKDELHASQHVQDRVDLWLDTRKAGRLSPEAPRESAAIGDLDTARSWRNRVARGAHHR